MSFKTQNKNTNKRFYGWKPDSPDFRDYIFQADFVKIATLPLSVDLRSQMPEVYDQGQLGSCTANAIAGGIESLMILEQKDTFVPSRLFIYYNERVLENTIKTDSGAMLRDGIKTVNQLGYCSELALPYNIAKFAKKPSAKIYKEALNNKVLTYQRVLRDLDQMKGVLAQNLPFVFGFSVYESFESASVAKSGIIPMPTKAESLLGGHAVACVGYTKDHFIMRNSWGNSWGDKGYFYMPFEYLLNRGLASDFWVMQTI